MPMHDWTRVKAGVFHHFHHRWIAAIADYLNAGLLPDGYYAMAEQVADGPIPDVLTLEHVLPEAGAEHPWSASDEGGPAGLAIAELPPQVTYTLEAEQQLYADKADRVAVFHASGDRVVGYIEIVSPGNKQSEYNVGRFLDKCAAAIEKNCHLLIIDPHPPTKRDPRGLHARFWGDHFGQPESPGVSADQPLGLMAYRSDLVPTAYFQPFGYGEALIDMPLFLDPDHYVNVPLEHTYAAAYATVPQRWRRVIEQPGDPNASPQ